MNKIRHCKISNKKISYIHHFTYAKAERPTNIFWSFNNRIVERKNIYVNAQVPNDLTKRPNIRTLEKTVIYYMFYFICILSNDKMKFY